MRQIVLNFHGIGTPERKLEPGEAPYWVDTDFFEGVLDLANAMKERVETTFSFDDGNTSDIRLAAPRLEARSRRGRFFPLAGRLDAEGSLTAKDLRALVAAGHIVGTHGFDHVDWTGLDEAGRAHEWLDARSILSEAAGAPIEDAAIPFGSYDGGVIRGMRAAGYKRIWSSDGGPWRSTDLPLPRTSPRCDMSLGDIEAILLGREPLKRRLRRRVARKVKMWRQ